MRLYITHPVPRWLTQIAADLRIRVCRWTEKEYMKHIVADFPSFVAMWSTEAGPDEFRTMCDWVLWVGLWRWPLDTD